MTEAVPARQAPLRTQVRAGIQALCGVLVGKDAQVRRSVAVLLSGGHLLLEDLPGVGKTTLAKGLCQLMGGTFQRIQGTNDLLRQNATLCASVEDVVAVLRPMIEAPDLFDRHGVEDDAGTPRYQNEPLWDELFAGEDGLAEAVIPGGLSEEAGRAPMEPVALPEDMQNAAARIVAALGPSPVDIDDLARLSGVSLREVQTILLDLDLDGRIERHGGNRVSLSP
ncbi:MAG: AAA family ATPase [Proteobacteria bacterium]|nr:AAA family ATPase [Pseudomonadota bacterium]